MLVKLFNENESKFLLTDTSQIILILFLFFAFKAVTWEDDSAFFSTERAFILCIVIDRFFILIIALIDDSEGFLESQ